MRVLKAAVYAPPGEPEPVPPATAEPTGSPPPAGEVEPRHARDVHSYLRGSSILLTGRVVSLLLNLAVQVVMVRVLTKSDYGAFAYAIGIVSLGSSGVVLGMDKAISRFVPIYQEHGEESKAFGTIALATVVVWGVGLIAVLLTFGLRGVLEARAVADPLALSLVMALIVLAPVQAFDSVLQNTLAIFVGARAIFFRRYIVAPGLKLAAVLLAAAVSGDVYMLAYGYLVGGIIGVALYIWILTRAWRDNGGLSRLRPRNIRIPAREVLGFSLPLLSSDLVILIPGSFLVILLEHYHATSVVAEFRAVLPVARLNHVVMQSFAMLFIPLAARMFARSDRQGLNDLYWRTAMWIAVLTFPVFAVTFGLAEPLTTLLFGAEYRSSASLLAVMAVGWYVNAALGFNSQTLRVHGNVRAIVLVNLAAALLGLAASMLLIVRFGAMGAAVGCAFTLILQNVLNHAGMMVVNTGVRLLDWRFLRIYLLISVMAGILLLVQRELALPLYAGIMLAALGSVLLIRLCRDALQVEQTFPQLLRLPLLRRLLGHS